MQQCRLIPFDTSQMVATVVPTFTTRDSTHYTFDSADTECDFGRPPRLYTTRMASILENTLHDNRTPSEKISSSAPCLTGVEWLGEGGLLEANLIACTSPIVQPRGGVKKIHTGVKFY